MFAANVQDKTSIRIDSSQYDAKSFSFGKSGYVRLYKDGAYGQAVGDSQLFSEIPTVEMSDVYCVNKYSDINLGGLLPEVERFAYDKDGYYGGSGNNINWRFVVTPVELHSDCINSTGLLGAKPKISTRNAPTTASTYQKNNMYYIKMDGTLEKGTIASDTDKYFGSHDIFTVSSLSYNDITTSSLLRSLKRDDVYRYGIVFYDKYGAHSDALWIADVRTPKAKEVPTTVWATSSDEINIYAQDDTSAGEKNLYALSLGIEFKIKRPQNISDNEIVGYQIVRCEKTVNTTKNILQVATSKPVH